MTFNPDSYKVTNHDRPFGVAPESPVDGIGWSSHTCCMQMKWKRAMPVMPLAGAARRLAGTGRYQIGRSLFGFTGGRHMHRG